MLIITYCFSVNKLSINANFADHTISSKNLVNLVVYIDYITPLSASIPV